MPDTDMTMKDIMGFVTAVHDNRTVSIETTHGKLVQFYMETEGLTEEQADERIASALISGEVRHA